MQSAAGTYSGHWARLPPCAQVKVPVSAAAISSWGGKSWSGICCALARPSNAVSHQGTACSTTEHLKPRRRVAQLTLTPVATKLLISAQEQQYRMVLSSGDLQMPWHGLAAQAGWMELCLSAKLHQTLSHYRQLTQTGSGFIAPIQFQHRLNLLLFS